jgi:hypothetical protein
VPCPECDQNHQRAARCEAAERSLLLFTETFSELAQQLWDLERAIDRRRYRESPPPEGAAPIRKRRFLLSMQIQLDPRQFLNPGRKIVRLPILRLNHFTQPLFSTLLVLVRT